MSEERKRKGVRISGNTSSLAVIKENAPHWIHHTRKDDSYWGGVIYLPECACSACGFTVTSEKKRCPHCGVLMW